ncbi:MAG TPA: ExeM/NucH family extracellular endonuclease [Burkholderiaceae bacterium]|jgi:hypothetical protein|nr:ExeM/NucH family extracellular endonuclease [Burkholderiaceae bacterium]
MTAAQALRCAAARAWLAAGICGCGDGTGSAGGAATVAQGPAGSPAEALSLSIPQIQGSASASSYAGREVVTRGVVTRVGGGGFFIQDPACDNSAGNSCGLFVFDDDAAALPGQLVEVEGQVSEFAPGRALAASGPTVTELTAIKGVRGLGTGSVIAPVVLPWPAASQQVLARYESMLVSLPGPFTVQQNFFLGRYGNVTLASGGRTLASTERAEPGAPARAAAVDAQRRTLLLDDGDDAQDPDPIPWLAADGTLRAGDEVATLTGVLDAGLAAPLAGPVLPRVRPTLPPAFVRMNPRPAAPADVGGDIRVASANLDNFFLTLADGKGRCAPSDTPTDCRGARNAAELQRQEAKLVEELAGLDADVIALMEVQNDGGEALRALTDALNARPGVSPYAPVVEPVAGSGTDAIRVALVYRPERLRLVGASESDPSPIHERAPLAQVFESLDGRWSFGVVASHFKSKNCGTPTGSNVDEGDGQGCWNARRVAQSQALQAFASGLESRTGVTNLLLVGDFNACSQEDPVHRLVAEGWIDETARYETGAYSYVFGAAACQLDHVYASPSLSAQVTGATDWHVNADEPSVIDYTLGFKQPACGHCAPDGYAVSPYRASDHDPVLVGIASTAVRSSSPPEAAGARQASPVVLGLSSTGRKAAP